MDFIVEVCLAEEEEQVGGAEQEARNGEVNGGVDATEDQDDGNGAEYDGDEGHHAASAVADEVGSVEAELEGEEDAGRQHQHQHRRQQVRVQLVNH